MYLAWRIMLEKILHRYMSRKKKISTTSGKKDSYPNEITHTPPPPPPSPIVFSVQLNLRTTNEQHIKKPLCSVPRQCFLFSWDFILFVVGLRNYVIYFKNLTSQEPNWNFCTTLEHMHSELNATLQT